MNPTQPIQIVLEAQQWNTVIDALHEVRYRLAAPIIDAILRQAKAQVDPKANQNGKRANRKTETHGNGLPNGTAKTNGEAAP